MDYWLSNGKVQAHFDDFEKAAKSFGSCHPKTLSMLEALCEAMKQSGRYAESLSFQRDHFISIPTSEAVQHPGVAVHMNQLALLFRLRGDFVTSEHLLRCALNIEKSALPHYHPKLPHRMNNLAVIMLLQGYYDEVDQLTRHAWDLKNGIHDITSERILVLRILLMFLTGRSAGQAIGMMKTLINRPKPENNGPVETRWNFLTTIEFFKRKMTEEQFQLLLSIMDAHNNRNACDAIGKRFPLWNCQSSVPLDEPLGQFPLRS